jgi:hypothetical protein
MPENLIPRAAPVLRSPPPASVSGEGRESQDRAQDEAQGPFARHTPTRAERKAFDAMQTDLIASYMVLGSVASSEAVAYHIVDNDLFPFAATDGVAVYLNRNSNPAPGSPNPKGGIFSLPREEATFVLAHEIVHILREDALNNYVYESQGCVRIPPPPMPKLGSMTSRTQISISLVIRNLRQNHPDGKLPFNPDVLNRAEDCIINSGLIADKVGKMPTRPNPARATNPHAPERLPLGCLHPLIDWNTDTQTAYAILFEEEESKSQSKSKSDSGSDSEFGNDGQSPGLGRDVLKPGSAGDPRKGKDDPGADNPIPASVAAGNLRATQPERQTALERAVNTARQAGQESSSVERMVRAAREPGIDWRQYFNGWVARAIGTSAYDWRRPMRRDMLRDEYGIGDSFFSPSRGGNACSRLVVAVDTSASIGEDEIRVALSVITEAMDDLNPKEGVTVIFCDSKVQRVQDVEPGEDMSQIHVPKGDGTSFIPPFEYVRNHFDNECDGLVYITDLYGPAPAEPPPYPVLWVCVTDRKGPWGETVNINVSQLTR